MLQDAQLLQRDRAAGCVIVLAKQYVIQTPLGGVAPLTSDNTPSSDPKPDPL